MRSWFRAMPMLVVGLIVIGSAVAARAAAADKPNIIFILADDLGYGELGCYGQKEIQTPNLDRMAAEGMRFTQMYAGSTVCSPSRAVLMTGLHTGHGWIRGNGREMLRPQDLIVPEVLKRAGYATGLCGKWGIGVEGSEGLPNLKGFDFFYGYLNNGHAHNHYPAFLWRDDSREALPNEQVKQSDSGAGVSSNKKVWSTDRICQEAVSFVERSKDRPFFLYLALTVPHANNEAGDKGMEVPAYDQYAPKDWPEPQKGQAAMDSRLDAHVGELLAKLKELKIDERTLVIFSSDNGPHAEGGNDPLFNDSNGPVRGKKRDLTDGGIRVPFIARWPGKVPPGATSDFIGYFADILPTFAELAGQPVPPCDGVSIVPTLFGKPDQPKHAYLYWEFHEGGFGQAVRKGDWKAIRSSRGLKPGAAPTLKLYNLADDIGEEKDVAAQHPDVAAEMAKLMETARTPWDSPRSTEGGAAPKKAAPKKQKGAAARAGQPAQTPTPRGSD